jgi:hypothetical protein
MMFKRSWSLSAAIGDVIPEGELSPLRREENMAASPKITTVLNLELEFGS